MDDMKDYLEQHRWQLLRYLDGEAPATKNEPDVRAYIDMVLHEWYVRFGSIRLPTPEPQERTFWFALYQLEELTELPSEGDPDPYEAVLMKDLVRVRELLRERLPLPHEYVATRPDGT